MLSLDAYPDDALLEPILEASAVIERPPIVAQRLLRLHPDARAVGLTHPLRRRACGKWPFRLACLVHRCDSAFALLLPVARRWLVRLHLEVVELWDLDL